MKILIADELPQDKIEVLREKGYECIVEPDLKACLLYTSPSPRD